VSTARDLLRIRQAGSKSRWAVPIGAVAAVGIVIAGSMIARGQATPTLPARTTAQLLAAVDNPAALPSAMTAVVQENASLGLPDLPGASDPLSGLSLLSGSHTFKIWYDGPAKVRVAIPVTMGETDLRRDGNSVWLWDSQTNQATHFVLPPGSATPTPPGSRSNPASASAVPTPPQLAKQILAAVGSTTTVGLQQNVTVAGQPAYQLSLAPKDSRSLIGQIRIAIDAQDSLPLQVQVFARGAASPAFSVGYTSLSFATPAASNFTFSPPPGAKVKTVRVPAGAGPLAGLGGLPNLPAGAISTGVPTAPLPTGSVTLRMSSGGGKTVIVNGGKPIPPAMQKELRVELVESLPASMPKAQRAALLKSLTSTRSRIQLPSTAGTVYSSTDVVGTAPSAAPTVLGKGWLSVAELLVPVNGVNGQAQSVLGALESAATPVHGAWGSGRLLRTSLFSVLLVSNGRVLVGAVVPSVLYADAAQLS
jgi:outer membrane lipoprotein-sorting protein